MKFGLQLEAYELPEWKGCYLPYNFLKRCLGSISSGQCAAAVEQLERALAHVEVEAGRSSCNSTPSATPIGILHGRVSRLRSPPSPQITSEGEQEQVLRLWWSCVEREATRIGACVDHRLQDLSVQMGELAAMRCECGSYVELQLLESLRRLSDGLARLRSFAELNHAALYKITKKHDKVQSTTLGLTAHFPRLVQALGKGDQRFESLEAQIQGHMLQCSQCQGLEASPQVALFAAGLSLGRGPTGQSGSDPLFLRRERMLFFYLGSCAALLLTIVILILLPAVQPETFDSAYFLASFSVFRVVWSVALVFWCMGTVARVCEDNFINHMFILSVDPRCRVTANYLFGKAAFLTSLWILFLAMYALDYKWMLLPTVMQKRHSEYRSSWHFVLYPLVLLCLSLVMMLLWPSKVCRMRYKFQLLGCLGRTCLAPLYAVSFADNLLGDVLTSLVKALEDIPSAICYLASHHPQLPEDVELFIKDGDTCPRWVHLGVTPAIGAAPFLFRLLQCARRYRDTKEVKHLWNMGKYMASLLVLLVTRLTKEAAVVVPVSVVATVWAATWDISMDWGLDRELLRGICARRRSSGQTPGASAGTAAGAAAAAARDLSIDLLSGQGASQRESSSDAGPISQVQSMVGPLPSGPRAAATVPPRLDSEESAAGRGQQEAASSSMRKRHFSRGTYCAAAAADLLTRLSWVLTLVPISLLSDDIAQRALLQTCIATVEILRRSMWTVLRIENEQVNNASGFRALHWVPLQMQQMQRMDQPGQLAGACTVKSLAG